ncbi:unnamed protein product [Phytophthora fragariaefolia]|uniref:Unnamed protein product n=1 Tax=Phytophthora fragariaefolia TaxID=1490495 RepID=A0A9W6XJ25_9STRA|nr:unnamed protein product [Phytophthora fragariaefolia]
MNNSNEGRIAAKREFSKLELELIQTANAALKFLKTLKSGLSKHDRRRGKYFVNTSKRFIKRDIRVVKSNAADMRYLATRIRKTKHPSKSEINAVRICMNQTTEAMIDLIRAARVYDHNYISSSSKVNPADDVLGAGDMMAEAKQVGKVSSKSMEDLLGSNSREFKMHAMDEPIKAPGTVESVVRLMLRSSFDGFNALRNQLVITEKTLAAALA